MKRIATLISFMFLYFFAFAQQADQIAGQLINSKNWLELNRQYPQLKSKIQTEMMRDLVDAMLGYQMNQPARAIPAINILLNKHQSEIGAQNTYNFILLLAKILYQQGRYADAAAMLNNVLPSLTQQRGQTIVDMLFTFNKEIQLVKGLPAMKVNRLPYDIVIPADDKWNIPVCVDDKTLNFAIDPQSEHTVLTKNIADSIGAKVLPDTVEHLGKKVMLALIEKMSLGQLEVQNVVADIPLSSDCRPVIGRDILSAIGETQLDFDNKLVVFPRSFTPLPKTGPNITWDLKFNISSNHHRVAINYKDMFVKEIGNDDTSMECGDKQLDEVSVTAARKLVKTGIGKLTYDVANDEESKSKSIFEILRKVPLVTVDGLDNILVKGQSAYKIYRNGHLDPTLSRATASDILKAIPASSIKSIEVITEPGAKYDAEGNSAILNIITQGNSILKGTTATLSANIDNCGTTKSSAYSATSIGKLTVSANYAYTHYVPKESESTVHSSLLYKQSNQLLDVMKHTKNNGNAHYLNVAASLDIDSLNLLSFSAGGYFLSYKTQAKSIYNRYENAKNLIYSYTEDNAIPHNRFDSYNVRLDYQHKMRHSEGTLSLSYMLNGTDNDMRNETAYSNMTNMPVAYTSYVKYAKSTFREHTFQLDYALPINRHNKLDVGAKYIHRLTKNTTSQDYNSDVDTGISSLFNHKTDILASYAEWNVEYGKWSVRPGLRYEYSRLKGFYPQGDAESYSCSLNDLVPSLNAMYKWNDANSIQLSYAMSISRPGINFLNPARIQQPETCTFGNTSLKSSRSSQLGLTWTATGSKTTNQLIAAYGFTNNFLTQIEYVEDNIRMQTFANALHVRMAALMDYLQWNPIPKTRLSLSGTIGWMKDYYPEKDIFNKGVYGNISCNLTQKLWWKLLLTVGGGTSFGHNLSGLYGRTANYHSDYISLQRSFMKNDILTLSLWATCPFENHKALTQHFTQGEYTGYARTVSVCRRFGINVSVKLGGSKKEVKKVGKEINNNDIVGGMEAPVR